MHQRVKKKTKWQFTVDIQGLGVQCSGLVAKPFSSAVDPDVGNLALGPLREAHVLLAHRLVEEGAVRHRRHRHLQPNTAPSLVSPLLRGKPLCRSLISPSRLVTVALQPAAAGNPHNLKNAFGSHCCQRLFFKTRPCSLHFITLFAAEQEISMEIGVPMTEGG